MLVNIDSIQASPNPIRKTWDEDKMEELAQSIKEQGLIVPIKVRPIGELFEVVYGHRRVEACRRAGLEEIEVIVEGVDDTDALIQALIENVVREDMNHVDEGNAYKKLIDVYGMAISAISSYTGKHYDWIRRCVRLAENESVIVLKDHDLFKSSIIIEKIKNDTERTEISNKVVNEDLSREQTRKVAESIANTKDPRRRQALIDAPYSPYTHDPEMNRERSERYGSADPYHNSREISNGAIFEMASEVTMIIDYLRKSSREMTGEVLNMYKIGKFSPEAVPFVIREAKKMIDAWQDVIDKLESSNE